MPRAKIIKFCLTCGQQISTRYARRRKFCSRKCHYAYAVSDETKKKLSVKAKKRWENPEYVENQRVMHLGKKGTGAKKKFIKYCIVCGELIKKRGNAPKYCSRKCYVIAKTGMTMSEECKQKHRVNWSNAAYLSKQQKSIKNRPNRCEIKVYTILDEVLPDTFAYTGDLGFMIGGKNPDFASMDDNKIIEFYGYHWHQDENPQDRIDYFAQYGYKAIVIWEHELKNIDTLKSKLLYFQYG